MEPSYLVFDLETVGLPIDSFDDTQQDYLLRGVATDEDRDKRIGEFALSPLTGKIVCIGMQMMTREGDAWTAKRVAYSVDPTMSDDQPVRHVELPLLEASQRTSQHHARLVQRTKLRRSMAHAS